MRLHKPPVGKFTEYHKLEEIHSVRSIAFTSSVLQLSLIQFNMLAICLCGYLSKMKRETVTYYLLLQGKINVPYCLHLTSFKLF